MSDPYEILDLSPLADEDEVRRRYLELVRQYPPDRDPERFAAIRAAYDELRDPATRLEAQLFQIGDGEPVEAIAADLRNRLRDRLDQIPVDLLLSLAKSS